jgi:hypothetical protein
MKKFGFPLFLVAIVAVMIGLFMIGNQPKPEKTIVGLQQFNLTDRNHVEAQVEYAQKPPVGGNHSATPATCTGTVYDQPIANENAVHSLEHGAVWVTYQPGLNQDDVQRLKSKVEGVDYTLMSPYPGQPGKITLTAWNNQLSLDSATDARIDEFLQKFRQGPQTPEPGASCEGVKPLQPPAAQ